jgi:hypothetical protein
VQDEQLAAGPIDLSTAVPTDLTLSFWISTNPYWASNANTQVFLSSDGVSWTLAWDCYVAYPPSFTWTEVALDIGAYAGGNLYFMVQYAGTDGADVHLDDFQVGYYVAPQPPDNDTCQGAIDNGYFILPGTIALTGNNELAAHDYTLDYTGSCTGYSCSGQDVVWVVDMEDGQVLDVTMTTTGWDDAIFLITDCADPQNTCVAGADDYPDGSTFSYTHAGAPTRFYLIVSAYSSGTGDFAVDGTLSAAVAVESSSWGQIKSLYH